MAAKQQNKQRKKKPSRTAAQVNRELRKWEDRYFTKLARRQRSKGDNR